MTDTRIRARKILGARELMLVQDCAADDMNNDELAEKYEVDKHTIENFKTRKWREIAAAAKEQVDKLEGFWIARVEYRVAQLQSEAERNIALIEAIEAESEQISESIGLPAPPDTSKVVQLQTNIFRALQMAAEQTGQLPTRNNEQAQGKKYRYSVDVPADWEDAA